MTASGPLSGAPPALELSAERPTPIAPRSIPPSPSPPLGLRFHTYKMAIIWSTPESEEELRTEPRTEKQSTWGVGWGAGSTLAPRTWLATGLKPLTAPAASPSGRCCYSRLLQSPHFADGNVEARGHGQTQKGQHSAWNLAAEVLASQDLRERRAGPPGTEVWLARGQLRVLSRQRGGARRPPQPEGRERRRWAGPRERGHLWGTMWAPRCSHSAAWPGSGEATAQTQQPLSAQLKGGAPRPWARSAACQEIYTRLLTTAWKQGRVLGPGWSAVNRPPVSR